MAWLLARVLLVALSILTGCAAPAQQPAAPVVSPPAPPATPPPITSPLWTILRGRSNRGSSKAALATAGGAPSAGSGGGTYQGGFGCRQFVFDRILLERNSFSKANMAVLQRLENGLSIYLFLL